MRWFYLTIGWFFFAVGLVGAFLPVLPTTPFMLLALVCFSRSSQRFYNWLYYHPVFGSTLQLWDKHHVIPITAKCVATFFMASSLIYLLFFRDFPLWLNLFVTLIMGFGLWFVLTKPSSPPASD